MNNIYLKARAKINLILNVLNKREDGYHNLESIFQKINLYDELFIEKIEKDKFILETNVEEINNKDNIIYKTYIELKKLYNIKSGIKVRLNKKIPMQAGLGGGSTDCASFILGMNRLFKLDLSEREIINIGKKLGADVVPCLYNKPILAKGKGEIVTKINADFKYYTIIIQPQFSCATGKMYQKIDDKNINQKINTEKMVKALKNKNINEISNNLYNTFEKVIDKKEIIDNIKENLKKNGAIGSLLCGSGSCVFGIFGNKEMAKKAFKELKETYNNTYFCISYSRKN